MTEIKQEIKVEGNEVVVRTGKVKDQPVRVNVVIASTDIDAAAKYWAMKKQHYTADKCHVLFDKHLGAIVLVMSEDDKEAQDKVSGKLSTNPELDKFQINQNHKQSHSDMLETIKWMRGMFANGKEYQDLVAALMDFSGKVEAQWDKMQDKQGNSKNSVITKVKQNIPLVFTLHAPIFIGQKKHSFPVEIVVTAQGSQLYFHLESIDLYDLVQTTREAIIDETLEKLKEIVQLEVAMK